MDNVFLELLDIEKCKSIIEKTIEGENAILCPNYSINIAMKYNNGEQLQFDWDDFEKAIGCSMEVSDFDDLIVSK